MVHASWTGFALHHCGPLRRPPVHPLLRPHRGVQSAVAEQLHGGSGFCSREAGLPSIATSCRRSTSRWTSITLEIPNTLPRSSTRWSSNHGNVNAADSTRRWPGHVLHVIGVMRPCPKIGTGASSLGLTGIRDNK